MLHGNNTLLKEKLANELVADILNENDLERLTVNADLLHIKAKEDKVDINSIKAVQQFLRFMPVNANYKVVLLEDLDLTNRYVHNALLKTLEELPLHTYIITTITILSRVPATLRSRCFKFRYDHDDKAFSNFYPKNPELEELYQEIRNIITNKNRDLVYLLNISEKAVTTNDSWQVAKTAILDAMREGIKNTTEKSLLLKRLQYYDNSKLLFANAEIYNLNKKDVIFNTLS